MPSRPWRCADGLESGSCTHSCGIVRDLIFARARQPRIEEAAPTDEKWRGTDALRGEPVLMDQSAEQITSADTIKVGDVGGCIAFARQPPAERRTLPEGTVRPVLVVMPRVGGKNAHDRLHARRQRTPLNAANSARSAGVSAGRATCRSSTRS